MKWKDEYEIGVEEIDNQHKVLVEMIDTFNTTISDKKINTIKEFGYILKYLINYTSFHFDAEEALMNEISYPGLDNQRKSHKNFIKQLQTVLIKIKNDQNYTVIEFHDLLFTWLNTHILDEDQKIGSFCKKNKKVFKANRMELKNPEIVIDMVTPHINRLDLMYDKQIISEEDRKLRRIIFLKNYYSNFLFIDADSLINVFSSLYMLGDNNIITKDELIELVNNLNLNEEYEKLTITDEIKKIVVNSLFNKFKKM
ncbi:MAG: bacteriohemerythrin [Spirochaetaceae bacterium]